MTKVIESKGLTRRFGKFTAVNQVSLSINQGEIYGFLGLNGAGKTTMIRMLLGMIKPTSGETIMKGIKVNAGRTDLWNSVGYMVEIPYSYPELTVAENLEIVRRLRFIQDNQAVNRIMEKLQLGQYRDKPAKYLSLGNSQRLGLAKALIHDPQILILDEPANGLDPAGIVEIRELLSDLAQNQGVTIFISSHILGEIAKFATRIGIIHKGKMVHESMLNELDKLRLRVLLIETKDQKAALTLIRKNGGQGEIAEDGIIRVTNFEALKSPEIIASQLAYAGNPPFLVKVEEEELEQFFLRTIGMDGGVQ